MVHSRIPMAVLVWSVGIVMSHVAIRLLLCWASEMMFAAPVHWAWLLWMKYWPRTCFHPGPTFIVWASRLVPLASVNVS